MTLLKNFVFKRIIGTNHNNTFKHKIKPNVKDKFKTIFKHKIKPIVKDKFKTIFKHKIKPIVKDKSNERQIHGFEFENEIIKRYNYTKSLIYTHEYDAYDNKIPIQIKYVKEKSCINFGDYFRNQNKKQDFILIIGFWKYENSLKITTKIFKLYIEYKNWNNLFNFKFKIKLKEELKLISNLKLDDYRWKKYCCKYKNLWYNQQKRYCSLRFKRDHKTQKRIQCGISNKNFHNYFLTNFKFENLNISYT